MTNEDILDYICNSTRLEDAIALDSSFVNLKEALCGDDREVALQTAGSLVSLGSTLDQVNTKVTREFFIPMVNDFSTGLFSEKTVSDCHSLCLNFIFTVQKPLTFSNICNYFMLSGRISRNISENIFLILHWYHQ